MEKIILWREIKLGDQRERREAREDSDGKEQEKGSAGDKQRFISV